LGSIFERAHFPVLNNRPDVGSIVGVESVPERRQFWKERAPQILLYDSIEEALAVGRYDCCVLATYPKGRAKLLRSLCENGITKVLCEKPLDVTLAALDTIQDLIEKFSLKFIPCHTWACSPIAKKVEEYSRKFISTPTQVRIVVERSGPAEGAKEGHPLWRVTPRLSGGGILMDHGYHCLCLAQRWIGDQVMHPLELSAEFDLGGIDWAAKAKFSSENGSQVELGLTWKGNKRHVSYEVSADGWSIVADEDNVVLNSPGRTPRVILFGTSLSTDGVHLDWYRELYELFLSPNESNAERIDFLTREALFANRAILAAYSLGK
jgi:predicted dehydrogenase